MPFTVIQIHELERDLCHAVLEYEGQRLTVMLKCSYADAALLASNFTAEIDHVAVVRFQMGQPPDNQASGLYSTEDPAVTLADGVVIHHLKLSPDYVLIDVHIQRGLLLLTLTSEDMDGAVPELGTRLQVWLKGLSVYPVRA